MNIQFFWDKKNRKSNRSRFNLLLLDYGEYFLEDFSAYHFPLPTNDLKQSFEIQDHAKIQGRLKLNSRSIIFEPNDVRYPLLKFPYKYMINELEKFSLKPKEQAQLSIQVNGFFTFLCGQYHEMKAHNKIGPYRVVEYSKSSTESVHGYRLLFALVYADLQLFLVKVEQFRHIFNMSERLGSIVASQHLRPFLENALISSFDTSNLVDFHERFLLQSPISVRKIKPLVANPGALVITELRIYFQPAQLNNIGDTTQHFELRKVIKIYKRRHMLRQIGLEFILLDGSSHLFVFETNQDRDRIFELLHQQDVVNKSHISLPEITRKWQKREISNFEYLMHLNNEAGRTNNDLTQYPVFPHILNDYKSRKLNLENPNTFRDFSKPIGALNVERLKYFKERFASMLPADPTMGIPPPFLYGTHYSTPGYVLYYLVRVAPEYMLCLQNGRFDASDRMFHSIADTWESCLTNPTDLKELIPEFFIGSGEFLVNIDDLDLGHRHSGERLHDVELPPWAESPRDFIRKHAKALESEYVSEHLHEWIDLIFGYKQQGQEAIKSDNLFYYLTYEGSVNLETVKDVRERAALEQQIQEFGQTPRQLFKAPHPIRRDLSASIIVTEAVQQTFEDYRILSEKSSGHNSNNASSQNLVEKGAAASSSNKEGGAGSEGRSERRSNEKNPPAPLPYGTNTILPNPPSSNSLASSSMKSNKSQQSLKAAQQAIGSGGGDHDDINDNIAIMHLGDDFRLEVERQLSNEKTPGGTSGKLAPPSSTSSNKSISMNNNSPMMSPVSSNRSIDITKMKMFPSEAYYWHTKAVTGVSVRIHPIPTDNTNNTIFGFFNRRKISATMCSVAKDSLLKVTKIELDLNGADFEKKAVYSMDKENVIRTHCTVSRSYSASGSSLSSVVLSPEGTKAIFASWDNHLYGYSIASATGIGKRYAHYDCVTSISVDKSNKWLLSGSLDASVKLWGLKPGASNIFSPGPVTEFSEHDYPVHCVAISGEGDYGAAGAEDGTLTIWDLNAQITQATHHCSEGKRTISAMKWLPTDSYPIQGFSSNKLIVATEDGNLLCLDSNGKLFAALKGDSSSPASSSSSSILSMDCDSRMIICGYQDGSIRVFIIVAGAFQLITNYSKAHGGGVTSICIGRLIEDNSISSSSSDGLAGANMNSNNNPAGPLTSASELFVSGSDDCSIRIWRLWYE